MSSLKTVVATEAPAELRVVVSSLPLRKTLLQRTEPDLFAKVATIDLPLVVIHGIASLAHPKIMTTWVGRCNVRPKVVDAMLQTRM